MLSGNHVLERKKNNLGTSGMHKANLYPEGPIRVQYDPKRSQAQAEDTKDEHNHTNRIDEVI